MSEYTPAQISRVSELRYERMRSLTKNFSC